MNTIHKSNNTVGNYIKKLRKEMGMTQAELGELTGTKRPNICKYERGTSGPSGAFILALQELHRRQETRRAV